MQDASSAFGGTKQHVLGKDADRSVESGVRYGSIPGLVADPNDAISLPEVWSTTHYGGIVQQMSGPVGLSLEL